MSKIQRGIKKIVSTQTSLSISYPKKMKSYNIFTKLKYIIQDFHYESGLRGILPEYRRNEFAFDSIKFMDQFYDYGKKRGKASTTLKIGENLELLINKVFYRICSFESYYSILENNLFQNI